MKNLIESDYIYFGFGKITKHLINQSILQEKSVICVSNQIYESSSNKKLTFIDYKTLIKHNVLSKNAIFSWQNSNSLSKTILEWISSDSFSVNKSFLMSSASVYRSSLEALDEKSSNLDYVFLTNAKYTLERNLVELLGNKNIKHTNLRISNVYGDKLEYGFIPSLINHIRGNVIAEIYNQKNITRDYLSINDIIYSIENLASADFQEENLNISTGVGTTLGKVLEIFSAFGFDFDSAKHIDAPSNLKKQVVLDCSNLKRIIDWRPTNLEDELAKILKNLLID